MGIEDHFSALGLVGGATAKQEVETSVEVKPNCVNYKLYAKNITEKCMKIR